MLRFYVDEDSMERALVAGLIRRGVDMWTVDQARQRGRTDEEQLAQAEGLGRVTITANAKDFQRLHATFLRAGRSHAGILVIQQSQFGIGERIRRIIRLASTLTAEDMRDRCEFISDWGVRRH